MPYIKKGRRAELAKTPVPRSSGELNYMITDLLCKYWKRSPKVYAAINDIIGAVEGSKLEFYRRIAVPYENQKMAENGDAYHDGSI